MVNIDQLIEADWNYKNNDEENARRLLENIRKNGQLETIIVRPVDNNFYEVVNGNHRLVAFRELGMESVMCCNVGDVSLATAKRIAVETNETRFSNNEAKLASILKEINLEYSLEDMSLTIPINEGIMADMIKAADFSFDGYTSSTTSAAIGVQNKQINDEFKTVTFRLPEGVADQLYAQIDRFKLALHPNDDPSEVSPVMAIEAMCQHLAQISDDQLL